MTLLSTRLVLQYKPHETDFINYKGDGFLASINDIAKAAGVSKATVSRIINGNPAISEETRQKVLKVMKELNYVPNSMARGLSNQQAFTVALLININDVKSFGNPFFYEVMHGIETVVYSRGLCMIIANLESSLKQNELLKWLIYGKRTQGVILPSSLMSNQLVKELKKIKFPFVTIGEPEGIKEPIDWVDINNYQGGMQALEHMLSQGYRRVAYIGGEQVKIFNKRRLGGYQAALEQNGLAYRPEYVCEGPSTKDNGYRSMKQLLSLPEPPDAIICSDNILCLGAMKAIHEAGLNIPNDVGILSFDNMPIADLVEPTLTTVDIDVFQLGVQTANILFKIIDNPEARQQQSLISTCIKMRESTCRKK